jgi:hypothetical protein
VGSGRTARGSAGRIAVADPAITAPASTTGAPHSRQKRLSSGVSRSQAWHVRMPSLRASAGLPHARQNFAPGRNGLSQWRQLTAGSDMASNLAS